MDGQPQQRHVAKLGKNTRLVCPVHADPPPLTQWKKDGQTINMGWPRFKVSIAGTHFKKSQLAGMRKSIFKSLEDI